MTNLLTQVKKKAPKILRDFQITKAGVFGSVAHGFENSRSDIDILVEMKKGSSLLDLLNVQIQLEKVLKRKVDLITYNSLNPKIKNIILNEEITIYEE